ncbi:MAG: sigma 54-interacting transcriptional regulator [Marinilabiliaceae bacterium]|nr:sigma 54-interacting transcriptional regulator [Marinilabiliaceae bacterium]
MAQRLKITGNTNNMLSKNNISNSSPDKVNLLEEALNEFVNNMNDANFQLIVVNAKQKVLQCYQSGVNRQIEIDVNDDWQTIYNKIAWNNNTGFKNGIGVTNNIAFNVIQYDALLPILELNIFLVSSIDIDFPWLNIAVSAIDTSIKSRFKKQLMQQEIDDNQQFTYAIMNALKVGIISVNTLGKIIYANNLACQWINIRRRELLTIPVKKIIPNWNSIYQIVSSGDRFINEEISINTTNKKIKYNVTVNPIMDQSQSKLIGLVIAIRELENVYNLVNKYTGMQARFSFNDIIAQSSKTLQLIEFAQNIADSPSTVLIEAESGTGKEVFAQSIHNASSRKEKGFVAINCAAISENLIESELFGYDDGAFSGAKKGGHPGKFELANGGTLFLDEIGDMKPELQVKLLRAIQEGAITRVGGEKNIPVDVRIIAATNKDLKKEVDKGNFRLDLYYRLSVIPLRIPPLRDRKEDIPPLITYFLNKKAIRLQKKIPHLNNTTLQNFLNYSWPGNIRELENTIEQFVILDGKISFDNLIINDQKKNDLKTGKELNTKKLLSLAEMEKELIFNTLLFTKNNMSLTAKHLGISRNTLYLKLKKHNLSN